MKAPHRLPFTSMHPAQEGSLITDALFFVHSLLLLHVFCQPIQTSVSAAPSLGPVAPHLQPDVKLNNMGLLTLVVHPLFLPRALRATAIIKFCLPIHRNGTVQTVKSIDNKKAGLVTTQEHIFQRTISPDNNSHFISVTHLRSC
jgi:hypothetical protein